MSRASAAGFNMTIAKTSSIFEVNQVRALNSHHEGDSSTSFAYEPAEDKLMSAKRTLTMFEPTYRLEPQTKVKLVVLENIINTVLEQRLAGQARSCMLYVPKLSLCVNILIVCIPSLYIVRNHVRLTL